MKQNAFILLLKIWIRQNARSPSYKRVVDGCIAVIFLCGSSSKRLVTYRSREFLRFEKQMEKETRKIIFIETRDEENVSIPTDCTSALRAVRESLESMWL